MAAREEVPHLGPVETRLFINNEFVEARSGNTFAVINPATEEVFQLVHEADVAEVDLAVNAAEAALPAWSALGGFQRAAYFYRLADLVEQSNDELSLIEASSMGRPVGTYSVFFFTQDTIFLLEC